MLKFSVSLLIFTLGCVGSESAFAANAKIQMTGVSVKRSPQGVSVDMSFDKPVSAKSLKPAFERNFVQLILKSTKMDSARMLPVAESEVQKVFAYPYSPDTARVRVIFKQDNQWAKGRISLWNNNPKSVRVFIKDAKTTETAGVSAVKKPVAPPVETKAVEAAPAKAEVVAKSHDEESLLKEVTSNTRDIDINNPDSVKAALTNPIKAKDEAASAPIGTNSDPSKHFLRMAVALFGILALFLGCALLVRRYASKLKKLPFGKKERLISVVATHYLGNKKSISMVKIAGEYMVVGVSNEGISLISKLGGDMNVDKYLEDRFWGGTFEKHLGSYANDSKVGKELDLSEELLDAVEVPKVAQIDRKKFNYDGVRDLGEKPQSSPAATLAQKVADRVDLSPIRTSIKEKLTKLKPLA